MSATKPGIAVAGGIARTTGGKATATDGSSRTTGGKATVTGGNATGPHVSTFETGGGGQAPGSIGERLRALAAARPDEPAVVDVGPVGKVGSAREVGVARDVGVAREVGAAREVGTAGGFGTTGEVGTPSEDRVLTWRALDRAVDRMADFLLRLGVHPGEPVCYQLPNWSEFVVISLAAARTGAVCCPLMPFFREREVAFVLERSRARVLFVPDAFRGRDYPAMVSSLGSLGALEHVVVVRSGLWADDAAAAVTGAGRPAGRRDPQWHRLEEAIGDLGADAVGDVAEEAVGDLGEDAVGGQAGGFVSVPYKGSARNDGPAPNESYPATEGPAPARRGNPSEDPAPDAFAQLLFTSGTSGEPKGVLHRHATLDRAVVMHIRHFRLTPADTVYIPSPLAHQTGFLYGMWLAIHLGAPQVLQDVWDPGVGLEVLRRWNVGFVQAATPFLADLVGAVIEGAAAPRRLRFFVATGATVPRALALDATRVLSTRVCGGWGSTESCMGTAGGPDDPPEKAWSTDGRPLDGIQVRIGDGRGSALPPETEGEFELRTPLMFAGYLDHPDWTADAYTPDGWYRTGDLAVLDHDGYIRITGRIKDVINRGGEKVPVAEVEQVLYEHPAVQEVAIVAMPDRRLGERACAFVVLRPGTAFDFEALCRHLDGHDMARQYWPERLEIVEALPYTPSGKIQKYRLRELASGLTPVSGTDPAPGRGAASGPGTAPEPGAASGSGTRVGRADQSEARA